MKKRYLIFLALFLLVIGTITVSAECTHPNKKWTYYHAETCITAGTCDWYCPDCEAKWTETIPATGVHQMEYDDWDSRTIEKRATPKADGNYTVKCQWCTHTESFPIYSPKTVKFTASSYVYNGKVQTPRIKVYDRVGKLVNARYYKVSFGAGRKYPGIYTVKVKFGYNNDDRDEVPYEGSIKTTFTIQPKPTKIKTIKATKAGFKISLKPVKTQTTGYDIRYSTSNTMEKAKKKTISNKYSTFTAKKLTRKCDYYVQVRTYKKVGKKKIYSNWSAIKTVTTK